MKRIQFTPDLLPSDVTGVSVYNQESREFEFKPGAVFANIVLGDEINRASPKTQSALLEAMEERQVTVDGTTYELGAPFMVIATQNPVEMEGTYPLPEAQRDRFMARVSMGYPDQKAELEMLDTHGGVSPLGRPAAGRRRRARSPAWSPPSRACTSPPAYGSTSSPSPTPPATQPSFGSAPHRERRSSWSVPRGPGRPSTTATT